MKKAIPTYGQTATGPLRSWDIFINHYHQLAALAEDAKQLKGLARKERWADDWDLDTILFKQNKVILVTDKKQHIIFASQNIFLLNGYTPAEVVGKTPKIFQGPETSLVETAAIRVALKETRSFNVCVKNYKKNGQLYTCAIEGFPVHTKTTSRSHFIAFEQMAN